MKKDIENQTGVSPIVRFRTSSAVEDTAEFATLEEALAGRRLGETITVVAYRDGEGSPFWAAVEISVKVGDDKPIVAE